MLSENETINSINQQFGEALKFARDTRSDFVRFRSTLDECGSKNWVQPESRAKLDELISRLDAIEKELANPTFKIAMIGTTSSGKSTLLNAMIGRRLAPVEAGEMSAGVVSIKHGEKLSMVVKKTQGMTWAAGEYKVHSDMEIYDAMRDSKQGIMALYRAAHAAAKEDTEVLAPQIEIIAPLAPKCGGIPDFKFHDCIDLQFFDLPGLKSERDRKNLQIIQQYLKNAFLIVVLNYSDTDTDKREKLLQEIYENVISVCKNKEAVLYVLNKVDQHSSNDNPIEDRCKEMQTAIRDKLKLENTPVVIPVSALPLFYIQTAFGVYGLERDMSDQVPEFVGQQLSSFFEDCLKSIKNMKRGSPEKKQWFNEHDDESDGDWSPSEIYKLLGWTYDESNVRAIWNELAVKLHAYMDAIIIAPVFGNFFNEVQSFVSSLNDQERILGLNTEKEINREKEELTNTVNKMNGIIKKFEDDLISKFQTALTSVKTKERAVNQDVVNSFFREQSSIMRDIRNSLIDTIAQPPLDYLSSSEIMAATMTSQLRDVLNAEMAAKVSDYAESLRNHGYTVEMARKGESGEFNEKELNQNTQYKKMQEIKKMMLGLYWHIKQAFVKRGEYLLQAHINDFSAGVQKLLHDERLKLFNDLSIVVGNKYSVLRPYEIKDFKVEVQLPDDVFTIPDEIASAKFTKKEGYQVETGSCITSTETRYRDVGMVRETIPSVDVIKGQWEDGVEKGENAIWEKMFQAIEKITIDEVIRISDNLENNAMLIENSLNRQFELVRQDKQSFIEFARQSLDLLNRRNKVSMEYHNSLIGESNA